MSNDKLAEIRKLAVRLQTAAYDHGSVDASDHWSDQKYADADDQSRSALTTLMDAVSDTLQAHAAAAPQPQAAEPVGYVDQQGGVIWYVDDLSWSRKPKAGTEVYTHPQPPAQDAKDAARYRWLKEHDNLHLLAEDVIDEAIAAIGTNC